ncbi:glycosyltransferase family 4 protein [Pseudomonas sp. ANT_H14]|uniref:glycosyltransferase family 4 protein n=1 Tax=unclassified Pseudomonas TaxID=196821 RepID=UPI0011F015E3|nr:MULTISPECIES: glycosyltransferase family 4 protein [unclassified Pseudomonas]KAA0947514.1 glycosyltransferase family 4 protein [Pseudomonas sp. ANT_H4]KAA0953932.1 glycosyltransferase family 4 protein [Pseudomonas sp. ANT_H14]
MRLLFISQLFDPEYSIKGLAYLKELQAQGMQIDVITTFPNYPTGKIFPGYKVRPWAVEQHGGVRIIRVWSFISHSKSKLARALSYASFMISSSIAALSVARPTIIYAYHPQLTTGIVASLVKLFKKVPFITDVQDLWPDALAATGLQKEGFIYRVLGKVCNKVYSNADHIVVLSDGYKKALVERGVSEEKITVIFNWHASEGLDVHQHSTERQARGGEFCYAGNIGAAQSLSAVIDAFSRFSEASVSLRLIGEGVEKEKLESYAVEIGAKNVFFSGYIQAAKVGIELARADVLVVHLRDDPLFKITIPSKTQAYLNSGKPILMAVGGEANQIILNAEAGVCASPENADEIAHAIQELISLREQWPVMGLAGKSFYQEKMSRAIGVKKTLSILNRLQARTQ